MSHLPLTPPADATHHALTLWAANCAEQVLPYFTSRHPADARPRNAIEAARAWVRGELPMSKAREAAFAAHAAARAANSPAAREAARAAGHAAATAHVVTHAPHAATYARKAIAHSTNSLPTVSPKQPFAPPP